MSTEAAGDHAEGSLLPMGENLPGYTEIEWNCTVIGAVETWPPLLKSFVTLAASFPHPAAVYWSEDLALIFNEQWHRMHADILQQGQAQAGRLDEKIVKTMHETMDRRARSDVPAASLLDHAPKDSRLLLSPVVDFASGRCCAVMAQLLPLRPDSTGGGGGGSSSSNTKAGADSGPLLPEPPARADSPSAASDASDKEVNFEKLPEPTAEGDGAVDDLALDEHPFFRRIASMLPTGLAILNHKAEAIFVNRQFYELTTHRESDKSFQSWPHTIHPEHYSRVMEAYRRAVDKKETLRIEFQSRGEEDLWRLLLLQPLGDISLRHASLRDHGGFICAVIDITKNKLAELTQKKAAQEAQERKEQQERFIDMISHEIRNPLSAVLHCAENVLDTVNSTSEIPQDARDQIIEAADTITLCVSHQKNIVDDILSFSKLDSSMLSLTPRSVQPKGQLADSLRMFQPEFRKHSIKFEYKVDWSYHDFRVEWVKADLVRMSQVLVNLITNAIKFTAKKAGKKEITVAMGASVDRPTSYPPNVVFFDTEDLGYRMDGTNTAEWGYGETLYIMLAVIDTGIGISDEGQKKLFQRFRQATPRTGEIYGGSGLGLNISRKLCHLHGGEIGVSSKEGEGSVFGFFFKVRRAEVPQGQTPPTAERLEDKELEHHVQQLDAAPHSPVDEDDVPPSLKDPKYEHVDEASVGAFRGSRWEHTAEIASHVKEASPDRYGTKGKTPKGRASEPEAHKKVPRRSQHTEVTAENAGDASSRPKVLLVEDNLINQRLLRRKLEAKGFFVLTANNGREAVDAVKTATHAAQASDAPHVGFDVILMDQEMPAMDGNTASRAIRKWEKDVARQQQEQQDAAKQEDEAAAAGGGGDGGAEKMHVPILGVSANVREEQKSNMRESGMDDVISKPYKIAEMVEKINGLIGKSGMGS